MKLGRRIAFDFGDVRIGVAVTDPSGILATPLNFLENSEASLSANLTSLYDEYQPIYTAIGFPSHLSGGESQKSKSVSEFAAKVSEITENPIYFIDERLTTVSASRTLREAGLNSKTSKGEIDSMAAAAILDSALNQERIQGEPMNRFTK
jgi:putative Holliday junction resolvase